MLHALFINLFDTAADAQTMECAVRKRELGAYEDGSIITPLYRDVSPFRSSGVPMVMSHFGRMSPLYNCIS